MKRLAIALAVVCSGCGSSKVVTVETAAVEVQTTTTTIFPPTTTTSTTAPPPPTTSSTSPMRGRKAGERVSRSSRPRVSGDGVWSALARCESSGNPGSVSADGRYSGAFQFSDATWHSLGMEGRAADHLYEVQLEAAKRLLARSGWSQWPRCSRRLGLR